MTRIFNDAIDGRTIKSIMYDMTRDQMRVHVRQRLNTHRQMQLIARNDASIECVVKMTRRDVCIATFIARMNNIKG